MYAIGTEMLVQSIPREILIAKAFRFLSTSIGV